MADIQRDNNGKKPGGVTGKGFVKGDPRINRNGRPKSFDALRKLALQISAEIVPDKARAPSVQKVLNANGTEREHILTVAEYILRLWASSNKPELQRAFMEIAFGKVPQNLDVTTDGKPLVQFVVTTDDADR